MKRSLVDVVETPIKKIKPKMILSGDLMSLEGRLLLPDGTILEDSHIRKLADWGINAIEVQENASTTQARASLRSIDPSIMKRSGELVAVFFQLAGLKHPAMKALYRITAIRTAEKLAAGKVMHHLTPDLLEETAPLTSLTAEEEAPPSLAQLLRREPALSSLPQIYHRIMEVVESPRSSAASVAQVVEKDPSLSARLLKLVNSPFYGFVAKVDSIQRAVAMVGINELMTLALGISVITVFSRVPKDLIDMKDFWKHSITCGIFSRLIAREIGLDSGERFFVAGLLHDLGRLVLLKQLPGAMTHAMVQAQLEPSPWYEAESKIIGFDHAMTAGLLLQEWKIPMELVSMIRFHHKPDQAPTPRDAAIIHLADILAIGSEIGQSNLRPVPPLNEEAWALLGINTGALAKFFPLAEEQIEDIFKVFTSDAVENPDRSTPTP